MGIYAVPNLGLIPMCCEHSGCATRMCGYAHFRTRSFGEHVQVFCWVYT